VDVSKGAVIGKASQAVTHRDDPSCPKAAFSAGIPEGVWFRYKSVTLHYRNFFVCFAANRKPVLNDRTIGRHPNKGRLKNEGEAGRSGIDLCH